MTPIYFTGTAATFNRVANNTKRDRFASQAFDSFIKRQDGKTPVYVEHDSSIKLDSAGPTQFPATKDALRVRFALNIDDYRTRGAALAVLHRHCTQLSIGYDVSRERRAVAWDHRACTDVTEASINEVSIVKTGALATSVAIEGQPVQAVRSWPKNADDRKLLAWFLERCAMPIPSSLPSVALELRPQRYGSDVWKTLHPSLVGFLKPGVAFDARVPLSGGKRVVDLLTEPQRQAMLDMILSD